MATEQTNHYMAFEDDECIASGPLEQVALEVKSLMDKGASGTILVFNAVTSDVTDLDLRGTRDDVLKRMKAVSAPGEARHQESETAAQPRRGRGRPKLGVVAREVTLLPRHWDWLNRQPGGASVALRKLVEDARRVYRQRDRIRLGKEVTYRFISVMAGNRPGFEEAARALFAGDRDRFHECSSAWPADIRKHARTLALNAFGEDDQENH